MTRQPLPAVAAAELARRYRARAEAEVRLSDYLRGVVDALGVDPSTVAGFDDETGELLLTEGDDGDRPREA